MLMDIELAGEGELRETMNQHREKLPSEEIAPEKQDLPEEKKPEESLRENMEPEEKVEEPGAEEEIPPVQEDGANADEKIENPREETIPPVSEKSTEKESVAQKKEDELSAKEPTIKEKESPGRKRDKKALMEVIRKAEKKKAKDKARKKLLEIVNDTTKKKKDDAFDRMLNKSIQDMKKNIGKGKKGDGRGWSGSGPGLSEGDYEMISSQIYPHWVVPSGVRDAENIIIEIRVQIKDNGQVILSSIKILDEKRYAADYIFRAAADSAKRAILEASPLRIPRDKMELFRDFILRFNLKEALGE
jgi:hypothetical protein